MTNDTASHTDKILVPNYISYITFIYIIFVFVADTPFLIFIVWIKIGF